MVFCDDWQRRLKQVSGRSAKGLVQGRSGTSCSTSGLLQTTRPVDLQIRRISSKSFGHCLSMRQLADWPQPKHRCQQLIGDVFQGIFAVTVVPFSLETICKVPPN